MVNVIFTFMECKAIQITQQLSKGSNTIPEYWPDKTRMIAVLPPRGSVSARHAASLVHFLDQSQRTVSTSASSGPAYAGQWLHFAPKRRFEPILAGLLEDRDEALILYPEALGFETISQKRWLHRRIEEFRRLKLVSRLVFTKSRVLLVFRPKKLWNPYIAAIVAITLVAKTIRPRRVKMVRRATSVRDLARDILGQKPAPVDPLDAEETVFKIAAAEGSSNGMHLSLAWFRRAVGHLPSGDPLKPELLTLVNACDLFSRKEPVPFGKPHAGKSTAPLKDKLAGIDEQVPLSSFMLHYHQLTGLESQFPLGQTRGRLGFLDWYMNRAPQLVDHALPLIPEVMAFWRRHQIIDAEIDTIASTIQTVGCDLTLSPYLFALYRNTSGQRQKFRVGNPRGRIAFAFLQVVNHARLQVQKDFAGSGLWHFFSAPVGNQTGNVSRLELMAAVLGHAPVADLSMLETPWKADEIRKWFAEISASGYPLLNTMIRDTAPQEAGLVITGDADKHTGLGRNQTMSAEALKGVKANRPVYLHHVNADAIPGQILRHNNPGGYHIGYLLWELEKLPESHMLANGLLDEIWVPSQFLQRIYQQEFNRPVTNIGKGFDLPTPAKFDLSIYGKAMPFSFLVCFDRHSSVTRKNPLSAVLAFQQAFPEDKSKQLIIKTTPAPENHWGDPDRQMQAIRRIATRDPRIVVDERFIPFADLLGLIRAVDCVVSAHKAEGFGYVPAYAQKLGTPVIATDFSGTTDFVTPETGFPVPYVMAKVKSGESIFPVPGARWAEIDEAALASTMLQVVSSPDKAKSRAANALVLMHDYYSSQALRQRYIDRLETLGLTGRSSFVHSSSDETKNRTIDRAGGVSSPPTP